MILMVSLDEIKDACVHYHSSRWTNFYVFFLLYTPAIHMDLSYLPNMWLILNPILVGLKIHVH